MTLPAHPGRMVFVNIPVADLERSKAFFAKLGFSYNPAFTEADDAEDYGFMYSRSLFDLDGHGWQVMWMNPAAAAEQGPEAFASSMQDAR
jgi:predicted lactoylglutathione lyase